MPNQIQEKKNNKLKKKIKYKFEKKIFKKKKLRHSIVAVTAAWLSCFFYASLDFIDYISILLCRVSMQN